MVGKTLGHYEAFPRPNGGGTLMLKRSLLLGGMLLAAALGASAAIAGLAQASALPMPPTLRGRYYFNAVEVRSGGTGFCDEFGTIDFDRGGTGLITATRRCNGVLFVTESNPMTWVVFPNREFEVTEVADPAGTAHGKILRGQQILLFDGTSITDSTRFVRNGVAVRE